MANHDLAMLTYLRLADLSRRKRQTLGSDKLLVLAGAAACRSGCLSVAERCRTIIVQHHPRHVLSRFATFADALRSQDFPPLLRRLEKLCSFEQAELLATEWGLSRDTHMELSAEEIATEAHRLLAAEDWLRAG